MIIAAVVYVMALSKLALICALFLCVRFSRLYCIYRIVTAIGADSMGAMAAISPTAKKLWGRCLQVAPKQFYVAIVHTIHSQDVQSNHECDIVKVKKVH